MILKDERERFLLSWSNVGPQSNKRNKKMKQMNSVKLVEELLKANVAISSSGGGGVRG